MAHHVVVTVDNIGGLTNALDDIQLELEQKLDRLVGELAAQGAMHASLGFARGQYDGEGGVADVTAENNGDGTAKVIASGDKVLFMEFGAGYLMGYGHPEPLGFGPGTYPGKGHWDDPNGWWYRWSDGHAHHSYGNPPSAAMYEARKYLEQNLAAIAGEIFG